MTLMVQDYLFLHPKNDHTREINDPPSLVPGAKRDQHQMLQRKCQVVPQKQQDHRGSFFLTPRNELSWNTSLYIHYNFIIYYKSQCCHPNKALLYPQRAEQWNGICIAWRLCRRLSENPTVLFYLMRFLKKNWTGWSKRLRVIKG